MCTETTEQKVHKSSLEAMWHAFEQEYKRQAICDISNKQMNGRCLFYGSSNDRDGQRNEWMQLNENGIECIANEHHKTAAERIIGKKSWKEYLPWLTINAPSSRENALKLVTLASRAINWHIVICQSELQVRANTRSTVDIELHISLLANHALSQPRERQHFLRNVCDDKTFR